MIYAVDFDGTLTLTNEFPRIGKANIPLFNYCKQLKKEGNKLILWTCRSGKWLDDAVEACKLYNLEFDAVNKNVPETLELFGKYGEGSKVYADFYIDDKNLLIKDVLKKYMY